MGPDVENERTTEPGRAASALSARLGMTVEEARRNAGNSLRYAWLVRYMTGPRTDLDDVIVAAKTQEEYDAILDADMMAATCIPNGEVRGASRLAGEASSREAATSTVVLEGKGKT